MSADRHPGRWIYVDSIRGIAALAVIYIHIAEVAHKNGFTSNSLEYYLFYFFAEYFDLGKSLLSCSSRFPVLLFLSLC